MKPRKAIARSTKPIQRSRIKKKPRSKSEFARIYGSKERVEFVKSLPCAACGVQGFSENAHVAPPGEKGTGYKAGYEWIVPLCGKRPRGLGEAMLWAIGCHRYHDEYPNFFRARFPDFWSEEAAAQTQAAWARAHQEAVR